MSIFDLCSKKLIKNIAVLMAMFLTMNGFSDKVVFAYTANETPSIFKAIKTQSELLQDGQAKPTPVLSQEVVFEPEPISAIEAQPTSAPKTNTQDKVVNSEVYKPSTAAATTPTQQPIHNKIVYSVKSEKKLVALTFDDGPDSYFTPMILDILKENNIKATFFVIGSSAEKNPEIVQRMEAEGHIVGNHSYDHKDMKKLSEDALRDEIQKTEQVLDNILGKHTPVFRPPYGSVNQKNVDQISEMGYSVVNWSVDTRDWAGTSQETMMNYVHKQMYPGGIILMHSSGRRTSIANTVKMLPTLIAELRDQGYEFVTVTELMEK